MRFHPPTVLHHATHFQDDVEVFNPLWVITMLSKLDEEPHRILKPVTDALAQVCAPAGVRYGRPRADGRLELAYFAFVFSRHPDVRPWLTTAGHSIWRTCGFSERPKYSLCQRRFAEMEHPLVIDAVEAVARTLISYAVKGSGGRVGTYLHVDATEAQAHARLVHACPSDRDCWKRWRRSSGHQRPRAISATVPTDEVREHRHEDALLPEPETDEPVIGDADQLVRHPKHLRVSVGGCEYDLPDPTAGIRAYINKGRVRRFWVGYYHHKAIDHYTGAPVAVRLASASVQEYLTYPELFAAASANIGSLPAAVVADRGFSITSVFQHNTLLGVGSVMPWRASKARPERSMEDCDTHDRHGVVRCKHCGGPTEHVSFSRTAGSKRGKSKRGPRLYVRCVAQTMAACKGRQSIACSTSWRMLGPLWRTDPVYLVLRHSHSRYERVHHHWRVRWRCAADHYTLRPKRSGIHNQQLRSNAAMAIEWLMICWREAWLPGMRAKTLDPERIITEDGAEHVKELERSRSRSGLDRPYGSRAKHLDIGPEHPEFDAGDDLSEPPDETTVDRGMAIEASPDPDDPDKIPNAAQIEIDDADPTDLDELGNDIDSAPDDHDEPDEEDEDDLPF